ncbi:MAG: GNAT family N-acetyltransferase [Chloroflexi bacterium]|nr:GNAT family N-acetyltransferase [Chloroflexota bacterium]MBL7061892.1 GNAT family N-acetyltransferase [Dehalococcoidia bacterium]
MRPEVRPMTDEDKPAVIQMLRNIPEFEPTEIDVAEEVINSYLGDSIRSGYHIFVAEVGSSIAGYICYGPTPLTEGTWDIYWLAVAPDKQSQGIGKALLNFADGNIKERKGRLALIETSSKPEYETTRLFYRAQGYEIACRIANFYAPGDDKLVFQKRLR